jgi:hypothetical protein
MCGCGCLCVCVCVCVRARARVCVCDIHYMYMYEHISPSLSYLWMDSLQICWAHTTNDHKLHVLHTYHISSSARVINCSLIYGRILFKCAVNILLHITTSSKGYVLFMFPHRAHACQRVCARARMVKHSIICGRILFKLDAGVHITNDHKLHVIHTYHVQAPCACVRARECERARDYAFDHL